MTQRPDHLFAHTPDALNLDPHVSRGARDLYDRLDIRAGKRGWFYPEGGQTELARSLHVSTRTIRKWEKELDDRGYIWRQRSADHRTTYTYWIIHRLRARAAKGDPLDEGDRPVPDEALDRINARRRTSAPSGSDSPLGAEDRFRSERKQIAAPRARTSDPSPQIPPETTPETPPAEPIARDRARAPAAAEPEVSDEIADEDLEIPEWRATNPPEPPASEINHVVRLFAGWSTARSGITAGLVRRWIRLGVTPAMWERAAGELRFRRHEKRGPIESIRSWLGAKLEDLLALAAHDRQTLDLEAYQVELRDGSLDEWLRDPVLVRRLYEAEQRRVRRGEPRAGALANDAVRDALQDEAQRREWIGLAENRPDPPC